MTTAMILKLITKDAPPPADPGAAADGGAGGQGAEAHLSRDGRRRLRHDPMGRAGVPADVCALCMTASVFFHVRVCARAHTLYICTHVYSRGD